jgi:hypothetical protein
LCRRHANALTVPRGWTIDDRRDPTPKLFRIEEDSASVRKPRVKKVGVEKPARERPSLFENNPEPSSPPIEQPSFAKVVADPDETQAIPWSPRFASSVERAAEDDSDQPIFGRLLGRAFGQQHKDV